MSVSGTEFLDGVGAILTRYFRQNAWPAPDPSELADVSARLLELLQARGLPPPLIEGETGAPGEMTAAEVAPLVDQVLGDAGSRERWLEPVRQLVKSCFHREFTTCRESYREKSPDGLCRRQQLERVRRRTSGSHCVDCPYWTSLDATAHAALLRASWCEEEATFDANREVFLPEDFRALRRWLHAAARTGIA